MSGPSAEFRPALEAYLRVIYRLSQSKEEVLQADVARELRRSKPSVCRAVTLLQAQGLLKKSRRGLVLTAEGLELERRLCRTREQLLEALTELGLPEDAAAAGAERIALEWDTGPTLPALSASDTPAASGG